MNTDPRQARDPASDRDRAASDRAAARLPGATARILATADALSDARAREPSPLPGWTRGHVLTHVARNADGLANLLRWARTGTKTPMYASRESRDADIEAGAGRPAADLAADVRRSAQAYAAAAAAMPDGAWDAMVATLGGPLPAWLVPLARLSEVEIHHVDLAAGYSPADWPAGFAADNLPRVAGSFAGRSDAPACLVTPEGSGTSLRIGPAPAGAGSGPPEVTVTGAPGDLLAWLTGRSSGSGLRVTGAAGPPVLPPW